MVIVVVTVLTVVLNIRAQPVPPEIRNRYAPDQCVTNFYSGEKKCPEQPSEVLLTDPLTETCNSPFTCESRLTPYAVQSDGSTDPTGVCKEGTVCRCVPRPQCPNFATIIFSTTQGNPYQAIDNQRLVFTQETGFIDLAGRYQMVGPIQYNNPVTQFCAIPSA